MCDPIVRKVEENDFYSLDKGNQKLRPKQDIGIDGLVLAGDWGYWMSILSRNVQVFLWNGYGN